MCNLYTVRKSAAEVAAHFGVSDPTQSNAPEEVYPGYPGSSHLKRSSIHFDFNQQE